VVLTFLLLSVLIISLHIVPKPNTSTVSPIIDLTMSLSPSPPPAQSQTYADVGTSPVPSPPPNAQPPKKIAGLGGPAHKDDRPADRHNAVPLNATPGEFFFSSFTAQLCGTGQN